MKSHLFKSILTFLICYCFLSNAKSQTDLSGIWTGQTAYGDRTGAVEVYLKKTGNYNYSGVTHITWSKPGEPSKEVKKKFSAILNENTLAVHEYEFIYRATPTSGVLIDYLLTIDNTGGQLKLTGQYPLTRYSTTLSQEYAAYLKESSNQNNTVTNDTAPGSNEVSGVDSSSLPDPKYVGSWYMMKAVADGKTLPATDSNFLDIFPYGFTVTRAKNATDSTFKSFACEWSVKGNVMNIIHSKFNFKLEQDILNLDWIKQPGDTLPGSPKQSWHITLKKMYKSPVKGYQTIPSIKALTGYWGYMHIYKDTEQMKGPWENMFIDFHPSSNSDGEMMFYVNPFEIGEVRFLKYEQSDDGKNLYSMRYNFYYDSVKDIRFFLSHEILLITDSDYTNPQLLEKVYSKSNFILDDVKKVFRKQMNAYSAYLPDNVHWTPCLACGGTGHFKTYNTDGDVHYSLCNICNGRGGKFFDDKGNEIDEEEFLP